MDKKQSVLQLFPMGFREKCTAALEYVDVLEEIRVRAKNPVCLYIQGKEYFMGNEGGLTFRREDAFHPSVGQVEELFNHICDYSPYAYQDELKQGFLTVARGHRIGVAGQAVAEGESVKSLKNIRFLNIRIAHEMLGVADEVLPFLFHKGKIKNTMIISPPGGGKTTLLRDLIRQISDGNTYANGMTVGVVDERSEIAGCFMGMPQNQVGSRTDVLDACPKTRGMMMLIRSMSPEVVAIDELGGMEDAVALRKVLHCGCKVLVTVHGKSMEEILHKKKLSEFILEKEFECFLVLKSRDGKREIEGYDWDGKKI